MPVTVLAFALEGSTATQYFDQTKPDQFYSGPSRTEILGNSGLSLTLPIAFKRSPIRKNISRAESSYYRESHRFENNGITVAISYTHYRDNVSSKRDELDHNNNKVANESVHQFLQETLASSLGINSQAIEKQTLTVSGHEAVDYQARYTLLPMAKQTLYRVRGIVDKSKVWVVTATVKDCDEYGQSILNSVMNSIKIDSEFIKSI